MATIVMQDGSERIVNDEQGRAVWALWSGFGKPKDSKQAAYVARVREVRFEGGATEPGPRTGERTAAPWEPRKILDAKARAIIQNPKLTGREKARRIAELLKKRKKARKGSIV